MSQEIIRGLGITQGLSRIDQVQAEAKARAATGIVEECPSLPDLRELRIPLSLEEALSHRKQSGIKRYSFI